VCVIYLLPRIVVAFLVPTSSVVSSGPFREQLEWSCASDPKRDDYAIEGSKLGIVVFATHPFSTEGLAVGVLLFASYSLLYDVG